MNDSPSSGPTTLRSRIKSIPYPWVVVGLSVIGSMGVAWPYQGIPILYPFMREDLDLTRGQIGFVTAGLLVAGIPTHVLGGWVIDAVGVRRVMTLVLVAQALATAGFFFGVSLPVILALAVLVGALEAPGFLGGARALIDWIPKRTRGVATGIWTTGGSLGGFITAASLPAIAETVGWHVAAVVLGALILVMAGIYGSLYRDAPQRGVGHPPFNWETFRLLAAHRGLVVATIWGSLFRGLSFTVVTYLLLFMTEELELSKVVAGLYLSTAYVISAGARVGWGAVSDFLFRARRLPACGLVGMLATAALAGIALTGSGLPESAVIVFVVLLGASTFSWAGLWTNLVGEMVSPEQSGTALGASGTVTSLVPLAFPPLFGLCVDWTDSYQLAWAIAAAIAFTSTAALVALAPREGYKKEELG